MGFWNQLFGKENNPTHESSNVKISGPFTDKNKFYLRIQRIQINGTNLSSELINKIKKGVFESIITGKRIDGNLLDEIPDDFQWDDYDKWFAIFKEADEWPYMWSESKKYTQTLKEFPLKSFNEIIHSLTKEEIINLTKKLDAVLTKQKSTKKVELVQNFLIVIKGKEDLIKQHLIEEHFNWWNNFWRKFGMPREKKKLLFHSIQGIAIIEENLADFRNLDIIKEVEIDTPTDSCSFCKKYTKKRYSLNQAFNIRTIGHPGCRCSVRPLVDSF
ncbi:MAG: hypothetical protein ABSE95_14895 [Thermodesulfobacteriota bacterium]|jgi:hypothetical protein